MTTPDANRRDALKKGGKALIGGALVGLAPFSPPSHGVWLEIARGISEGIAKFCDAVIDEFGDWWVQTQKDNDTKVIAAQSRVEDSHSQFKIDMENKRRIREMTPSASQCLRKAEAEVLAEKISTEKHKKATLPSGSATAIGGFKQESPINSGMRYYGMQGSKYNPVKAAKRTSEIKSKIVKKEAISESDAIAITKVDLANTTNLVMNPLRSGLDSIGNDVGTQDAERINYLSSKAASLSAVSKVLVESIHTNDAAKYSAPTATREQLHVIGSRFFDPTYDDEVKGMVSTTALIAELSKLAGEKIYVMNAQYQKNEEQIALLALAIIELSRG